MSMYITLTQSSMIQTVKHLTHSYSPVTKSSPAIAGQKDTIRNLQPCILSNRYSQRCHLIHMKLEFEEWKKRCICIWSYRDTSKEKRWIWGYNCHMTSHVYPLLVCFDNSLV